MSHRVAPPTNLRRTIKILGFALLGATGLNLTACSGALVTQGPVQMPVPVPKRPANTPRPLPPLDPPPAPTPAPTPAPETPETAKRETVEPKTATPKQSNENVEAIKKASTQSAFVDASNDTLNALLWMQTSIEYRAATLQGYRLARERLEAALADPQWSIFSQSTGRGLPPAVILDVDETVLDNSVFEARLMRDGKGANKEHFLQWCREEKATAIAGALEFTRFAASKGVEVFYVTNRDAEVEEATANNLAQLGFPGIEHPRLENLMTRGERQEWGSDKSSRWREIARTYRVLLMVGDDLGDFVGPARTSPEAREAILLETAERWGRQWILLPNPRYGSWEKALYFGTGTPSSTEKKALKLRALKTQP